MSKNIIKLNYYIERLKKDLSKYNCQNRATVVYLMYCIRTFIYYIHIVKSNVLLHYFNKIFLKIHLRRHKT